MTATARPTTTAAPVSAAGERWATYTVQAGDSLYGIAGRLAGGDRTRTREVAEQILERNHGRLMADGQRFTSAGYIAPNWTLDIPTTPTTTAARLGG